MGAARWAPLSGIAFVALWIVTMILIGSGANTDSDKDILAYYADKSHRSKEIAAYFLIVVASLFFLWFVTVLRGRLAQAEGKAGTLTALAFGAGLVSAALWIVAGSAFTAISAGYGDKGFVLDPNTYRLINDFGYGVFVGAAMAAIPLVFCTALLSVRAGVLPKWIGWLSFVVAVGLLISVAFIPFMVLLGWVLVVSIVLIARPAKPAQPAAAA